MGTVAFSLRSGGNYLVTEIQHFALRDPDPTCIRYGNAFRECRDRRREASP